MSSQCPPISSIYIASTDKVPLSLCFIGGLALNINFIECSYRCSFCPWEANLDLRSANVVTPDFDQLKLVIQKYKPDLLFLNGGDFWRFEFIDSFIEKVLGFDILKGLKIVSPNQYYKFIDKMMNILEFFDVVLIEVNIFSDIFIACSIVERFIRSKHFEIVVVSNNLDNVENKVKELVNRLTESSIYIPINLLVQYFDELKLYTFIDSIRTVYPLIYTSEARTSEHSSILCPRCRNPVVVKQGDQLLKISLDNYCRCKYCGFKVISSDRNLCIARRIFKIPIRIPIA